MKHILLVFMLYGTFFYTQAQTLEEENNIIVEDTSKFANYICAIYYNSLNEADQASYFNSRIMKYFNIDENHPESRKFVGKILNQFHNVLICGRDSVHFLRDSEPLIKRSIGRGEYGLIEHLMLYENDYNYNLNHYEIVDGKKETILDYIEEILNTPSILEGYNEDKIRVLHSDFIEYEAKRGSEL